MANTENDELFSGNLDSKMDFLNDKKTVNADGLYRIDIKNIKDKKKGYRSVVRFLPNFTKDGTMGQSAIEKITHYVDIKNQKELSGFFDSPKNFDQKCPLTDLFYSMQNSKNAILQEKSKCLKYSKKYYSYVLILEDEHQPELVGKIMVLQYGKIIKDKILSEKNGEISGVSNNIFSLENGKDFVLLVKEIQTGEETYPDYKHSMFKQENSSLPIYFEEKGVFKNTPLVNGKIDPKYHGAVKEFLLKREHELEEFSAKPLTDEQHAKITEISNYLTGKSSNSFNSRESAKASSDDFELSGVIESSGNDDEDVDDFFKDL